MKISLLKNVFDKSTKNTIEFESYFGNIKNCVWQNDIIEVRRFRVKYKAGEIEKSVYQDIKTKIPCVTASGCFSYCNAQGLIEHSGIIAIDFDEEDNPDGINPEELAADAYTYGIHRSVGGDGWVIYVKIDPKKHLEAFLGLEAHYANNYKLVADPSCKDVSRLRYVSADENAMLLTESKIFKNYLDPKIIAPTGRVYTQQPNDIEHIINQISMRAIDLVSNYSDWLNVGFGFAREYGEAGRSYFHDVSRTSTKYDPEYADKKYTHLLGRCSAYSGNQRKAGLGTFIALAKNANLEIKTPITALVETVAKSRRNMVGQNGGFKDVQQAEDGTVEYLEKMEGIAPEVSRPIAKLVMEMSAEQIKSSLSGDIVKDTECYVKMLGLRYNEVLKQTEHNGEPLNDYATNGLFVDALKALKDSQKGKTLGRELFETMINSPIVERYHPFKDFFTKHTGVKKIGIVGELVDCIKMRDYTDEERDFLQMCVTKWLLSIIASMNGIHSVMCLVLCSKMGKGKTKFFRELLPMELRPYYTESSLDRDKDSDIEMSENLLICDDEFEGKSKGDAKKMRSMLSKEKFKTRAAYARRAEKYHRYAVLCGTSNEEDVLNDLEGNRRFIPINIIDIDFDKFDKINKTDLFMELYEMYLEAPKYFMLTADEVKILNGATVKNEESCIELEAFSMYFGSPEDYPNCKPEFYTPTQIKMEIEQLSKTLKISLKKLGAVMKKLNFTKIAKKVQSTTIYGYKIVKLIV